MVIMVGWFEEVELRLTWRKDLLFIECANALRLVELKTRRWCIDRENVGRVISNCSGLRRDYNSRG
jgi:hypothetical protein